MINIMKKKPTKSTGTPPTAVKHSRRPDKAHKIMIGITLVSVVLMILNSKWRSLWFDDMAQISFITKGLSVGEIMNRLIAGDNNPPLYTFLAVIWIRIMPYGTAWMKLLSVLLVGMGLYILGLTAFKLGGLRNAVCVIIVASCSSFLIGDAAFTFRPYGLLFLTASLSLFSYAERGNGGNKRALVKYGVSMLLLLYTHYFGILVCGAYFVLDFMAYRKRQIKLDCVMSYFIAGITYLPWMFLGFFNSLEKTATFWPSVPTLQSVFSLVVHTILSSSLLFQTAMATAIVFYLYTAKKDRSQHFPEADPNGKFCRDTFWTICFVLGFAYIYSTIINPAGSIFVPRYFISILPHSFILVAFGIDVLFTHICPDRHEKMSPMLLIILAIILVPTSFLTIEANQQKIYQPWEEAADWLMERPDIYDETTLTVFTTSVDPAGWDYYLTRNGQRPPIARDSGGNAAEKGLDNYNTIYVFEVHNNLASSRNGTLPQLLADEFEAVGTHESLAITLYKRIS